MSVQAVESIELCPQCGYSLRGLPEPRCPECGLHVTAEHIRAAVLPWETRRSIPTFCATAMRVLGNPKGMNLLLSTESSPRAARWFGRLCVLIVGLGLGVLVLLDHDGLREEIDGELPGSGYITPNWGQIELLGPWLIGLWQWGVLALAILVGFWLVAWLTRLPFWFGPPELRVRRLTLARYATIALPALIAGFVPLTFVLLMQWYTGDDEMWGEATLWLHVAVGLFPLLWAFLVWWRVRQMVIALGCGALGHVAAWLILPIGLLGFTVGVTVVPWLIGFALIVWTSLG